MVEPDPSEKYEFVNWDDEMPKIWKNKSHLPNHQPVNYLSLFLVLTIDHSPKLKAIVITGNSKQFGIVVRRRNRETMHSFLNQILLDFRDLYNMTRIQNVDPCQSFGVRFLAPYLFYFGLEAP